MFQSLAPPRRSFFFASRFSQSLSSFVRGVFVPRQDLRHPAEVADERRVRQIARIEEGIIQPPLQGRVRVRTAASN
jgi:hypothetical protein